MLRDLIPTAVKATMQAEVNLFTGKIRIAPLLLAVLTSHSLYSLRLETGRGLGTS